MFMAGLSNFEKRIFHFLEWMIFSLFFAIFFFISHSSNNYYPMEKLISSPSLSGTIYVDIENFVIQTVFQWENL